MCYYTNSSKEQVSVCRKKPHNKSQVKDDKLAKKKKIHKQIQIQTLMICNKEG